MIGFHLIIGRKRGTLATGWKHLVDAWRIAMAKTTASKVFRDDVFKRHGRLNTMSGEELTATIHAVMNLPKTQIADAKAYFQQLIPATATKKK